MAGVATTIWPDADLGAGRGPAAQRVVSGSAAAGQPLSGYRVAGLCVLVGRRNGRGAESAVFARLAEIARTAATTGAGAVAVASCESLGPAEMRYLAWQLEGTGIRLVLAPSLVDVAGPRIHVSQVAGLPLLQVESPRFTGPKAVVKNRFGHHGRHPRPAGALAPDPRGGRRDQAGRRWAGVLPANPGRLGGRTFEMWKFRSMHVDADRRLSDLRDRSHGNGVLFKMKDDPRITAVWQGDSTVLHRRTATAGQRVDPADEPGRSAAATDVRGGNLRNRCPSPVPGQTGNDGAVAGQWALDLSWEESVRLDLYYVENWSCVGDLIILARTVMAVAGSNGAY